MEDLKGFLPAKLEEFFEHMGEPRYRGRQVFSWIHRRLANSFEEMTDLPKSLRELLGSVARISSVKELTKQVSRDGTVKYLLGMEDGHAIETVKMEYEHGIVVCVSTQVGCKMGCAICASGITGFVRNLTSGEMVDQVLYVEGQVRLRGARVGNVVLMGSGEPLDNYEAVVRFMRIINAPHGLGISYRRMTLSTCGLVPGIKRLALERLPITLSVSLHASNDELRDELVPINRRFPLAELMDACRYYASFTGRRVTFEYSLIEGVNDGQREARKLAVLLEGMPCHVNLIPVNPVRERGYVRPGRGRVEEFRQELAKRGINATIRRELGTDIDAACGQLRRRYYVIPEHTFHG